MENKIKVGFIFHKDNYFLLGKHFDNTYYNFFRKALKRNDRILVKDFITDDVFDGSCLDKEVDVILLWENSPFGMPRELQNMKKLEMPVISRTGDPSRANASKKLHDEWKIDYYFDFFSDSFFHKIYPREFNYKRIFYGLESSLFQNVKPFSERKKNRILNSGNIGNDKFLSKLINDIRNPKWNSYRCKVLRTKCSKLDYVDYSFTQNHDFINDRYTLLLQQYQTAIAADTYTPVQKYWEIPASGCLTFMEITKKNDGTHIGFRDNETAIFINERNYKEKFLDYLNDNENKKWKEIADAGREFAIKNFNNDLAVERLADLMEEII